MRSIALGACLPLLCAAAAAAQSAPGGAVTPAGLVVRSGPGTTYRQVGVLQQGANVTVTGAAQGSWIPVRFAGGSGWVPARFIKTGAAAPAQTSGAGFTPTPLGGAANPIQVPVGSSAAARPSSQGGIGNFVGNLLGSAAGSLLGGRAQPGSAGASNLLGGLLGGGSSSSGGLLSGLLGGSNLLQGLTGGSNAAASPLSALAGSATRSLLGSSSGQTAPAVQQALPAIQQALPAVQQALAPAGAPAPTSTGGNALSALLGGQGNAGALAQVGGSALSALLGGSSSRTGAGPVQVISGQSPFASQQGTGLGSFVPPAGSTVPSGDPSVLALGTGAAGGQTAIVSAPILNVRTGPGSHYRIIGLMVQGTQVPLLSTSGVWFRVRQPSGVEGWVHGAYLRGGSGQLAPTSSIPSGGQMAGIQGDLPGSSGGGTPAGAGGERRSRAGFIQLPTRGTGYYGYYAASKRWGTPRLVYGIMRVGQRLQQGGLPSLGVGDISLENGGDIAGHASHERGVDVDCRPLRTDRAESPTTIAQDAYSPGWTATALRLFMAETPVSLIFFNDPILIRQLGPVQRWPNHDNHFHVRVR